MGEGSTAYAGPVITSGHVVGGRRFALVAPGDPDRLLDDPRVLAWNHRDDYMPYWAYSCRVRSCSPRRWRRRHWEPGTPALEIGCGLGLAGPGGLGRGLRVDVHRLRRGPARVHCPERPGETGSIRRGMPLADSTGATCPTSGFR